MQVNLANFERAITYVIAPPDDRSQAVRPTERTIRRSTFLGAALEPQHFDWQVEDGAATITLNRPNRKNPLTFDSNGELRDTFRELQFVTDVKAVVITGAGGNFCSGGDVHDIIGPLVEMDMTGSSSSPR